MPALRAVSATRWIVAIAALLTLSCRETDVVAPGATAPPSNAAKAATGAPTVSSTSPSYGRQGTVALDVHIFGTGFDAGSRASWQKNGQVYPKIVVNSTRYVSAKELVANISIASDAAVDSYDVAVTAAGGKPGIGTEMFTVTLAVSIEEPTGRAVNDGGQIVGQSTTGAASLWDPAVGYVLLDAGGMVWDIDRSGTYIGGRNAAGDPVVWTSSNGPAGPWVATTLPSLGEGGAVRGVASDADGVTRMMVGNAFSGARKNPIVWTRTGAGWSHRIFPVPAAVTGGAWGQAINPRGMVVGMQGSGCCYAVFWDSLGAPTILQPIASGAAAAAWSIDDAGTTTVGQSNGVAVMWTRTLVNGVYGPWSIAKRLEGGKATCRGGSIANAVNGAGTVAVGSSCGAPVAWFLGDGVVVERRLLIGLGPPNSGAAFGINDLPNPIITGEGNNGGVYWRTF